MTNPISGAPILPSHITAAITSALAALTWSSWTPTLTNLTTGSGTRTSRYIQIGKTVHWFFVWVYGSGSSVGTNPQFTLPVAPNSSYAAAADLHEFCSGSLYDASAPAVRFASGVLATGGSTVVINSMNATPTTAQVTSAAPWSWATGDRIYMYGTYEAA